MSEEAILHLIYHAVGIILGMVIGWLLRSNREKGLGSTSSGVSESIRECDKLTTEINNAAIETEQLDRDLKESADSIGRISAIFDKYGETTQSSENEE